MGDQGTEGQVDGQRKDGPASYYLAGGPRAQPPGPAFLGSWELVEGQRSAWSQRAEHLAPASGVSLKTSPPRAQSCGPLPHKPGVSANPMRPSAAPWWGGERRHQGGRVGGGPRSGHAGSRGEHSQQAPGGGSPPCRTLGSCRAGRALRGRVAVGGAWRAQGPLPELRCPGTACSR